MSYTELILFLGVFVIVVSASYLILLGVSPSWNKTAPIIDHISNQTPLEPETNNSSEPLWKTNPKYCEKDSDCIVATLSCCPCNMGGKPECVNREYYEEYKKTQNCPKNIVCPAVYYCDMITSCACVNNTCQPA